jgi:threonine synthase
MAISFRCAGCGASMPADASGPYPFRCPASGPGDDVDHVVHRAFGTNGGPLPEATEPDPFVRYRALLSSHAVALSRGVSDEAYTALVRDLGAAVGRVDGAGFRETPFRPWPALGERLGFSRGEVWVKDETGDVAGSHKARHLMGIMLHLLVRDPAAPAGPDCRPTDPGRADLAIASCGNAALAAAVIARAADWPLRVFVPPSVDAAVIARLQALGARIEVCERETGVMGDPAHVAFRRAVDAGAIPFCCQGPDNGLTIEGGETLAWEMVSAFRQAGARQWGATRLDAVFIQVGGGALASAIIQGFGEAQAAGTVDRLPRFYTVQTSGAYPLKRAYDELAARILMRIPLVVGQGFSPAADRERADLIASHPTLVDEELSEARRHRSRFMQPWYKEPRSIAHGILDDETYDWAAVVEGMLRTGGWPLVVSEDRLVEANVLARDVTGIPVDHTGSAGLAGLMKATGLDRRLADERVALIFSGVDRQALPSATT